MVDSKVLDQAELKRLAERIAVAQKSAAAEPQKLNQAKAKGGVR
jgi:hypothetical protein